MCPTRGHPQWAVPSASPVTPAARADRQQSATVHWLPFLRPAGRRSRLVHPVSLSFGKRSRGPGTPLLLTPGRVAGPRASAGGGAGEARKGTRGGAPMEDARLTSLRRPRGCPAAAATAAPLRLPSPQPEPVRAGQRGGGGERGLSSSGREAHPRPPAVKVNVKESAPAAGYVRAPLRAPLAARPAALSRQPCSPRRRGQMDARDEERYW